MTARDYTTATTDAAAAHASQFTSGYDDVPETLGAEDFCAAGHFDCPVTCRYYREPVPLEESIALIQALQRSVNARRSA